MTARIVACRDLANNEADLRKIKELFLTLRTGATLSSLTLPWFPSPARRRVKHAATELFTMLSAYVEARRQAAEPTSDAIDILIADEATTQSIVGVGLVLRVA